MREHRYLLNIQELEQTDESGELWQRVLRLLDCDRVKKSEKMKSRKARALNAGAGLLLQWAYREYLAENESQHILGNVNSFHYIYRITSERMGCSNLKTAVNCVHEYKKMKADSERDDGQIELEELFPETILDRIEKRFDFEIIFGKKGKPAIKGSPFYYNLSHSGDYVFCGVSDHEIGVDIQKERRNDEREPEKILHLAERFFSAEEYFRLREAEGMQLIQMFYTMWSKKEAIGKLHGDGLIDWIGRNTLCDQNEDERGYLWEEYEKDQYRISVCRFLSGEDALHE